MIKKLRKKVVLLTMTSLLALLTLVVVPLVYMLVEEYREKREAGASEA